MDSIPDEREIYKVFFEHPLLGILVFQDGRLLYTNQITSDIIGYPLEEIKHWTLQDCVNIVHPDDQAMVWKNYEKRIKAEDVPSVYEYRIITKSGKVIWVSQYAKLISYQNRIATEAVIIDITHRQEILEKLQENEEKLRNIVNNTSDGIYILDLSGKIIDVNEPLAKMTGYTVDELKNMHADDFVSLEDSIRYRRYIRQKLDGTKIKTLYQIDLIKKDKEKIKVEIVSQLFHLGDKSPLILGVIRDISDRLKLEEERIRSDKLESLGILAGGIAHDFNNILAALLGNLSLLKIDTNPEDEKYQLLQEAENATIRAKDLTNQLLSFAKGGKLEKKISSITDLIKESSSFVLRGSKSKIIFDFNENLIPVNIDASQISQVIHNLIINADQAMPQGGTIKISVKNVNIDEKENPNIISGSYLKISIKDEGHGIPDHLQKRIFEPYFTTKTMGSGLGLTTAYSIIRNHNGYINFKSKEGIGTTFFIYLPTVELNLSNISSKHSNDVKFVYKILIKDDDVNVQKMLNRILNKMGHNVVFAGSRKNFIEFYKKAKSTQEPFDLLIMDLKMTRREKDIETIKEFLKFDEDVKIIAAIEYPHDPILKDYKEFGFSAVLKKPFLVGELESTINEVMK